MILSCKGASTGLVSALPCRRVWRFPWSWAHTMLLHWSVRRCCDLKSHTCVGHTSVGSCFSRVMSSFSPRAPRDHMLPSNCTRTWGEFLHHSSQGSTWRRWAGTSNGRGELETREDVEEGQGGELPGEES